MFEVIKTKTLYLHFNKQVNYLENKNKKKMEEIAKYLQAIISQNRYLDLLRTVNRN